MKCITIIGGGASGLAVGAILSKAGIKSSIIEKNARVGKKLLTTGNGRCNLGNSNLDMGKYHGDVDFARRIFLDWQGAEKFFRDLGLICRADDKGRLYPYSNTANSVLDALRAACTHVNFRLETEVCELPKGIVVIATGNQLSLVKGQLPIVRPFPALCPIMTEKTGLKGLRVRALVSAVADGRVLKSELGEVQFNENNLSGICIMNLSRLVRDYGDNLTISLDIAPEFTAEQLADIPLTGLFHRRIAETVTNPKKWEFPVTGVYGTENAGKAGSATGGSPAQIMAGGVSAAELNDDCSVKKYPRLYVVGEAVNVDGDCGGYNLEWAWASAHAAAKGIIKSL
jgi:hypothetical protein